MNTLPGMTETSLLPKIAAAAGMSFNDLIEVQPRAGGQLEVGLRNLEYDLTKSSTRVLKDFPTISASLEFSVT